MGNAPFESIGGRTKMPSSKETAQGRKPKQPSRPDLAGSQEQTGALARADAGVQEAAPPLRSLKVHSCL